MSKYKDSPSDSTSYPFQFLISSGVQAPLTPWILNTLIWTMRFSLNLLSAILPSSMTRKMVCAEKLWLVIVVTSFSPMTHILSASCRIIHLCHCKNPHPPNDVPLSRAYIGTGIISVKPSDITTHLRDPPSSWPSHPWFPHPSDITSTITCWWCPLCAAGAHALLSLW